DEFVHAMMTKGRVRQRFDVRSYRLVMAANARLRIEGLTVPWRTALPGGAVISSIAPAARGRSPGRSCSSPRRVDGFRGESEPAAPRERASPVPGGFCVWGEDAAIATIVPMRAGRKKKLDAAARLPALPSRMRGAARVEAFCRTRLVHVKG